MKRLGIAGLGAALLATVSVVPTQAVPMGSLQRDMQTVAAARVLFGHQSVGWNILDGMQRLYSTQGIAAPRMVDGAAALPATGRGFAQEEIGVNGDPRSKFAAIAAALDSGHAVDVAVMKLCYVDIVAGSDVRGTFAAYRQMINDLSERHPGVHFVHMTVPLTTNDPSSNRARQRYNQLMRATYGNLVFDLARIESTRPNGSRVTGTKGGQRYYALYAGYAADDGHLNSRGSLLVARGFVRALAAAA